MKFLRNTALFFAACLAFTGVAGALPISLTAHATKNPEQPVEEVTVREPFVLDDDGLVIYVIESNTSDSKPDDGKYATVYGLMDSDYKGTVNILSEIRGVPVREIESNALSDCNELTAVVIPDSVTKIGKEAFAYCGNLETITIPESVTFFGENAFVRTPWYNNQLKDSPFLIVNQILIDGRNAEGDVVIPDGVKEIYAQAFQGNTALTGVTVPDSVTVIGTKAFKSCWSLESVTVPGSVKCIDSGAFNDCRKLKRAALSEGTETIGDKAFHGCEKLTEFTIPGTVKEIGADAFHGCASLKEITLPGGLDTISAGTFCGCRGLTSVNVPEKVTCIEAGAFYGCSGITKVTLPDALTRIEQGAFANCTNLAEITIPETLTDFGGHVFFGTKWLENKQKENPIVIVNQVLIDGLAAEGDVTIPDGVAAITDYAFSMPDDKENPKLTGITIAESVKKVGISVCRKCTNLKSFSIPKTMTVIPFGMFESCSSLESITVPEWVTKIEDRAFKNCSALKSITILNTGCIIRSDAFEGAYVLWGDANSDGMVDIADAVLICRYSVSDAEATISDRGKSNADVTHDGRVDTKDSEKLLDFIAKKVKSLEP